MGQATGSQKAGPKMSWPGDDAYQATHRLRLQIRQLTNELEAAEAAGNYSEANRTREKLKPLNDSLNNWVRLMRSLDEAEEDET